MKEQLYTIPVNDAFNEPCECPLCKIYDNLEQESIDFMLGPSYMEDDIRMETNKTGFCTKHIKQLYDRQNRLGIALMLHTHMEHTGEHIEKMAKSCNSSKKSLFGKKEKSPLIDYIKEIENSCYICNRIENVFDRYIKTVIHCYTHDDDFKKKFNESKGFCTKHYGMLYEYAEKTLNSSALNNFISDLNDIYINNFKRVTDELEWFIDKFDYKNENEPWKNSKDAIQRSILKTNGLFIE
ncbi:MAG: hypothetical protein BHW08_08430 [Clostridium sp. CAG:12237_41]|nr:MAG: hypothetical protein BHW08_08430 [Clostridium sp. CAG:12237_41]